jgi:tyrosinase
MLDPIASPGDPIFYLHHTWLDKIFWEWQVLDLPARLSDMGGKNAVQQLSLPSGPNGGGPPGGGDPDLPIIFPNLSEFPPLDAMRPLPDSPPQLPAGDPGNVTTLAHILNMFGVIPNATVADVMDIRGPLLCYEYV